MSRYNKDLGDFGEEMAARFLAEKGCEILERNYNVRGGEIDIICMDKGELVFVEVKTRRSEKYGLPSEAIDRRKAEHMRFAAERYFQLNPVDCNIRFDAIEIYAAMSGGVYELFEIKHIKDIILD